ncbi:MAG: hypothetical protein ACRD0L_16020, partial [Acidimicrobiales bacterium]
AYPSLSWDPPPLFQDYVAYTPWLDQADAGLLGSSDAPARILRRAGPVLDHRYPAFTPPATQVALVCNYAQLRATARWQVLAQVAPRCSQPTVVRTVHTGWDRWVTVPAAPRGDAVLAAWGPLPRPLGARLAGVVLRPPVVHVQVKGPKGTAVATYRFIPATAGDQHLVVPPSTLGSTGPYVPTAVRAMRLTGGGLGRSTSGVTVTFYAMPVLPAKP